jgi:hypothetical protein
MQLCTISMLTFIKSSKNGIKTSRQPILSSLSSGSRILRIPLCARKPRELPGHMERRERQAKRIDTMKPAGTPEQLEQQVKLVALVVLPVLQERPVKPVALVEPQAAKAADLAELLVLLPVKPDVLVEPQAAKVADLAELLVLLPVKAVASVVPPAARVVDLDEPLAEMVAADLVELRAAKAADLAVHPAKVAADLAVHLAVAERAEGCAAADSQSLSSLPGYKIVLGRDNR